MEEVLKKQLKIKLIISVFFVAIIIVFFGLNNSYKNITGNSVIEPKTVGECTYGGATYDGSFMKVFSPENNTYTGENGFNITVVTDYYGTDILTSCVGYDATNCTLKIISAMSSKTNDGFVNKTIDIPSLELPKINSGNTTFSYTTVSSNENYTDGNFTIKTSVKYSCEAEEFKTEYTYVQVHLSSPVITEIYPTNNLVINISSNTTTTIFPKLNATDTLGILNRTFYDGNKTISLIGNSNYNVTLPVGTYTWNFTATDLAGNKEMVISTFRIVNSSTNITQNNTNQTNTTSNATILFGNTTTEDNKLTNTSSVFIKLNANSTNSSNNITLRIFDSSGKIIYQNSTTQNTMEKSYVFITDGIYYYNATLVSGNETRFTPTRKIIIDREAPTISIISPSKIQSNFTNSIALEFSASDENGISRRWFNDGIKDADYIGRINQNLTNGNYTWTVYARDNAGNFAKETIKFMIISKEKKSLTKTIAILIIIIALALLVFVGIFYFMRKNSEQQTQPSNFVSPSVPINGQAQIPIQATFKNNQPLQ